MKRSDYHKILGCLVGAGEIELAQAFKASRQKAHAELMNPTKYAKEAKRLGITEYNAKTSLKLDRKLLVDSIWVLDNWPAIEKALKREGIVVKARAIARMTKSAYHTILGMSKNDIGRVCVVNRNAKREIGLIVSTSQVYVFDRCVLVNVQSDQISNISKRKVTSMIALRY